MGEAIPYDDYLFNTMGVRPVTFSHSKIAALREEANAALAPFKLEIREGISEKLEAHDVNVAKEEIVPFFSKQHEIFYPAIRPFIRTDAEFNVNYKEKDENTADVMWIRGDGREYSLEFNLYHMKEYRATRLKILSAHEITAHAVQFSALRRQADQKLLPRYMSYITVHEPSMFAAEGLAVSLPYFYPEQFEQSPTMKATMAVHRLKRNVANNTHVMLNQGVPFKESTEYFYENFPDLPIAKAGNWLEAFANKPTGSSYLTVYGQAFETFLEISQTHSDKDGFIRSVYNDYLMPQDIQKDLPHPICDFV